MGQVFSGLFGNNDKAKKAAEASRKAQEIANTRQLAELNRRDQDTTVVRRNPRGRRLFSDAATGDAGGKSNLS